MALCFIEAELWPIEVYIAGIRTFDLFCSCDLDLAPMTFIYELDPYSRMCSMNFLRQGFRKLSSERQTDTTDVIYHAASRVVNE